MKIALLSYEYPPETGFGGIGSYTWHHARALVALGHEVHVLAGARSATPLRSTDDDGVHVHRFWAGGWLMRTFDQAARMGWWWTRQRLQNAWSMYLGFTELQRLHHFDVLEMPECGAEGALLTRWLKLPMVVRVHSPAYSIMPFYETRRLDRWLCSAIERLALRRATALTACSQFAADLVPRELDVERGCRVISNGLDLAWIDAGPPAVDLSQKYQLPRRMLTIVFAGRMERRKGIHLGAEIAARILERHDVTLLFAGEDLFGYMASTLLPALAAKKLRGSVHFLGKLVMSDVRELVRSADIFLLPSLWENCPYACLEAMAAGRAVVAARQGGMPELIEHGNNGLLAAVDDPAGFIECLEQLIGDPQLRMRLGRAARATVERSHDAMRLAAVAVAVYQQAIADGAEQPAPDDVPALRAGEDDGRLPVIAAATEWTVNGVNVFSANLVRGLAADGVAAQILLTEQDTRLVAATERRMPRPLGVSFRSLPLSPDDSWGARWGGMQRHLEESAPCIYIPNSDWRHSVICPRLSDEVIIIGVVHSDDPLHYDHVRRLGAYWNVIVTVSAAIAKKTALLCPELAGRIVTIPIGARVPDALPAREPLPRVLRLIYHGTLKQHQKRVLDLPRFVQTALDRGVAVQLSIVGAGPDEDALRASARSLLDREAIVFHGVCAPDDIVAVLEQHDVYVLASEFEGMPNALIEAMGRGCVPIVTQMQSGIPELIRHGENGFTIPIGDADAFAECVRQLAADPDLVERLSRAAFATVRQGAFRVENMVTAYRRVFEQAREDVRAGRFRRPRGELSPPPAEVAGVSLFPVELTHVLPGVGVFPSPSEADEYDLQVQATVARSKGARSWRVQQVREASRQVALEGVTVFVAAPVWTWNGVNLWAEDVVRGLRQARVDARVLLTEEATPLVNIDEARMDRPGDLCFQELKLSGEDCWGARWGAMIRTLEAAAPCIYIPNYDWRHSCVTPILSDGVRVIGMFHQFSELYREHAERLGDGWNASVATSMEISRNARRQLPTAEGRLRTIAYGLDFPAAAVAPRAAGASVQVVLVATSADDSSPAGAWIERLARALLQQQFAVTVLRVDQGGRDTRVEDAPGVHSLIRPSRQQWLAACRSSQFVVAQGHCDSLTRPWLEAVGNGCIPVWIGPPSADELVRSVAACGVRCALDELEETADRLLGTLRDGPARERILRMAHALVLKGCVRNAPMIDAYAQLLREVLVSPQISRYRRPRGPIQPPPPTVGDSGIFSLPLSTQSAFGSFPSANDLRRFQEEAGPWIRPLEPGRKPRRRY